MTDQPLPAPAPDPVPPTSPAPPAPVTGPGGSGAVARPDTSRAPADPLQLRASDADRERFVAVLREAYAEGRLEGDEYQERMDTAYRAKTYADLVPLVLDVPVPPGALPVPVAGAGHAGAAARVPHGAGPAAGRGGGVAPLGAWGIEVAPAGSPAPSDQPAVAIFGGAERRGRWVVPERSSAVAVFGGVELDLTQAVLAAPVVEITAVALFGGVEITVPHGVTVELTGFAIFGGRSGPKDEVLPPPNGPVVRVNGFAMFGGIDVKRPKGPPAPPAVTA